MRRDMGYRLKWEHANGYAECPEGWVEQVQSERWWDAFMNYIDANGEQDSRELGTFLTLGDHPKPASRGHLKTGQL